MSYVIVQINIALLLYEFNHLWFQRADELNLSVVNQEEIFDDLIHMGFAEYLRVSYKRHLFSATRMDISKCLYPEMSEIMQRFFAQHIDERTFNFFFTSKVKMIVFGDILTVGKITNNFPHRSNLDAP